MRGTNKKVGQVDGDGTSLSVVEVFDSIQGEGPFSGCPAVFIRLAQCNLACIWCDTAFESGTMMSVDAIIDLIVSYSFGSERLVVITGGEPLLHPLEPLLTQFKAQSIGFQIETSGTLSPAWFERMVPAHSPANIALYSGSVVVSPKTGRIEPIVENRASAYKYIIRAGELDPVDGLPRYSTQVDGRVASIFRPTKGFPRRSVYVQPCDEADKKKNEANLLAAQQSCMQFGYRLSMQQHKVLGLR